MQSPLSLVFKFRDGFSTWITISTYLYFASLVITTVTNLLNFQEMDFSFGLHNKHFFLQRFKGKPWIGVRG
ncbi:hypothetical protein [Trichoplusia ni ascovirus 6b]|nr:hypothetical protein [Trichoplusia ni ascovirus 6b]